MIGNSVSRFFLHRNNAFRSMQMKNKVTKKTGKIPFFNTCFQFPNFHFKIFTQKFCTQAIFSYCRDLTKKDVQMPCPYMNIQWRRENESFAFPASTSPFVLILHVIPLKSKLKVFIPFLTFPTKEYIYVKGTFTYCKQILTKGHKISISSVLASDYDNARVILKVFGN